MVEHPRTIEQNAVLALAFTELLDAPRPVTVPLLAERLDTQISAVKEQLAALAERGWIRRDPEGSIVGSRGLSIEPTRHELELPQGRRYTWCAYDTLGIFGALAVSGRIRSRTPLEQPVELEVMDGLPVAADGVVLFFPQRQVTSVVDEWCPLANFFLDADAARIWATANSVEGQVLTLDEASERGRADWRDCCESCDCLPPAAGGVTVEG
jgi:alkylmercury lyase-like protein